jgi:hypothetical protein
MSTIYDKPGAGWNIINTDNCFTNYYQTNEMGDVVQQEKKSTTPQQFEEDHITLDVFFSWVTPPVSHTYHTHNLQHT